MIRKRLRKIEQIDSQLDNQLQDLHISQKESTHRLQEQINRIIEKKNDDEELQYRLNEQFKVQILGSLNKLHQRIDKLEQRINQQKTNKKNSLNLKHQRNSSFKENINKSFNLQINKSNNKQKDKQDQKNKQLNSKNNSLYLLPKRKKSFNLQNISQSHIKTFSIITPKNCDTTKRNSYSSVKVLEGMIEEQLTNLKQNKHKERIKLEESRTDKKNIEQKIRKIGGVIQNQKNMENLYKNLEWQTKQLVDTLNETRSLCSYQKQKIQIYKSKLKLLKKGGGKQNL